MNSANTYLLSVFLLAFFIQPLHAIEVYQWTDANGVVHFSQWAPDDQQGDVQLVSVDGGEGAENGLGISEEDDPEGYLAHREQMDALWADMEARREAERERQSQAARTELIYVQPESGYAYDYPYIFPGYGNRPPHRPGRPPHKPRPLPVEPERPGNGAIKTATLKRP